MNLAHRIVLRHIGEHGIDRATGRRKQVDIRAMSEPYRQRIIDLAMMEPPLVDIDGNHLFLTDAGIGKLVQINHES